MKKTKFVNPTMFFFVNKSLKMSSGKLAAQIAHAKEELTYEIFKYANKEKQEEYLECLEQNPRTVIVLEAENTDELYKINSYLESSEIWTGIYVDEKGSDYLLEPTVMCTEYLDKEDPKVKLIFKMFKLYNPERDLLDEIEEAYTSSIFSLRRYKDFTNRIEYIYKDKTGKKLQ